MTCLTGEDLLTLAATYYTILLKYVYLGLGTFKLHLVLVLYHVSRRTGGSESFGEKKVFFFQQLIKHHEDLNHQHRRLPVQIDRYNVFESTYR